MEKEFPDDGEVQTFVGSFAPLLARAMKLRTIPISDREFCKRGKEVKQAIIDAVEHSAKHAGIQRIQDIFREKAHRMYHWADDRNVPAENNFVERELRGVVIARKVSFGSQSDAGAHTREILMSVLFTLKKRYDHFQTRFKQALDELAQNPRLDPHKVLFEPQTS